ncbi:hypothetical protein ACVCII_29595 [Burkholderia glumae]|uniref:hypothetical protein n=1 Tax=Burkholderia glumae TaxID=337 RepID=UPI002037436E|nr:hypothetical protein [Burkholderia glumae]MCM2547374.1 hypothetical protein [Burkholderia glumae]
MNHFKDDCIASSSLPEIRASGGRLEAKPTSRLSFGMSGATPDFTVDTSDSGDGGGLLEAQSRDSLMVTINAANSGMRTLFAPSGAKMLRPYERQRLLYGKYRIFGQWSSGIRHAAELLFARLMLVVPDAAR